LQPPLATHLLKNPSEVDCKSLSCQLKKGPYIGVNAAVLLQFLLMQIRQFSVQVKRNIFLDASPIYYYLFFLACVVCALSSCLELTLLLDIFSCI